MNLVFVGYLTINEWGWVYLMKNYGDWGGFYPSRG